MKKIYAILVAAAMSVSVFAAPTQADLQSYMEEGFYVACFQAPEGSTCNDIYWMGTYAEWNISTPLEDLVKCEELTGANAGWYVAKVPVVEGQSNDGKPIQLNECGKMTWDVQPSNAPIDVIAGSVVVDSKDNGESDLKEWSADEPTIISITSWKNDYNPCEMVCEQQVYTIRIYPPYCEYLEDLEPTIKGSFNNWGDAITMEFKGSYFEYVTEPVTANFEFKFNNDPAGSWTHEFVYYDEENDATTGVPASGNLSLTNGTEFYTREGNILTFDFSDDTKFQYGGCEEQEEAVEAHVIISLKAPAGAPEAGIEMGGNFASDDWSVFQPMTFEDGLYKAEMDVLSTKEFKFRETGSWDNEIMKKDDNTGKWMSLPNFKFGAIWEDAGENKVINLDFSGAEYGWKSITDGIEHVILTEKAHKVVVDGVLYIVRDNKLYNAQGTQVR